MKVIFWLCFAVTFYAYLGYALLLWLQVCLNSYPSIHGFITPSVSIIIAVRNEEATLPPKLENLKRLNYPKDLLEVFVVSDGSTDRTAEILLEQSSGVTAIILEGSHGKASALNEAVRRATGEVLVFQDARQSVDCDAVSALVSCFVDPSVGAVSGELVLQAEGAASSDALSVYWKVEKMIRKLESASGSVVGVTGAIYAIRRELYAQIPANTILDDLFVPMTVALKGKRVIFQPTAVARDKIFSEKGKEFSRKVRTLTGNYQLLRVAPWLLSPTNPLLFRFISHKLLRLTIPALLILMLVASLLSEGTFYRAVFWVQMVFYFLGLIGISAPVSRRFRPAAIAATFVMLNAAAAVAFYNWVIGQDKVWT